MAVVNMSKKIDVYLEDKALFQTDLNLQHKEWKQNLVLPYGSCYTMAYNSVLGKLEAAKEERKAYEKRMKEIAELQMAICLFVLDVAATSALSKAVGSVSRLKSTKSIDFFLTEAKSSGQAATEFLQQSESFTDVVIGNLASKSSDKIKDKVILDGFKKAVTAGQTDIKTTAVDFSKQAKDPLVHQNDLLIRLSRSITGVEKMYINGVRDVAMPNEIKAILIFWLTTVPIARPPARAFPSSALSGWLEVLLWCEMIFNAANSTISAAKAKKEKVPYILAHFDRFAARKMNDHFKSYTNYHLTSGGYNTGKEPPAQWQWHGIVYPDHLVGLKKMAAVCASFIAVYVSHLHTQD